MVQWFCLISWRLFDGYVIIGILVPCDAKIYLIKCMWVSDLHFMVQCFCHILKTYLLDECCTGDIDLMWQENWPEAKCRSVTYISWSGDFVLYLEDYLMDKCHNWDIGSIRCKDLPHKIYLSQWPTFHGSVILSYILKTIWWMNDVLEILILVWQENLKLYM